jgi:hypothetical protein
MHGYVRAVTVQSEKIAQTDSRLHASVGEIHTQCSKGRPPMNTMSGIRGGMDVSNNSGEDTQYRTGTGTTK